jgi:hypothetical protein
MCGVASIGVGNVLRSERFALAMWIWVVTPRDWGGRGWPLLGERIAEQQRKSIPSLRLTKLPSNSHDKLKSQRETPLSV